MPQHTERAALVAVRPVHGEGNVQNLARVGRSDARSHRSWGR
jgi:hypothetical protein